MFRRFITACFCIAALSVSGVLNAQQVKLKVLDWNVLSLEETEFNIDRYVEFVKAENPDVICFNEFETGTSRMDTKEKMSEFASALGMYGYYIKSYPKDSGFYGNVILSKYPIISSASHLFPFEHYLGEGNYQWNTGNEELKNKYGGDQRSVGYADILVPVSATENVIVRIICSHFDNSGGSECRTTQSEESVSFCGLWSPVYPAIMCGDLNTTSTSELKALYDAGDHAGVSWVDHMFSFPKGRWTSANFKSIGTGGGLSDHDAIVAEFTLNQ